MSKTTPATKSSKHATKPTPTPVTTAPQPEPSRILEDVANLGINPTSEVVGGREERADELRQKIAELRAGRVEGGKVDTKRIRGERMVASEIVVTAEELKTERENGEVERESEREEKTEEVEGAGEEEKMQGERMVESEAAEDEETFKAEKEKEKTEELEEGRESDVKRKVSMETVRLGSEDGSKVSGDKGMEDVSKPAEEQDDEMEDDCKVVTKTEATRTGNDNEGEAVTKEIRRKRRFSRRLAGILASDKGLCEEENVDKAGEEPAETDEEMETSQPDQEGEDEDNIPLKSRLRSNKATDQVADSAERSEDSTSTAQSNANIPPTPEEADVESEIPQEEEES